MRCLSNCQGGGGKHKGMENMFVKQILQLGGWLNGKGGKREKETVYRTWLVVWNQTPKFSQGRALLGFWGSVGIGRTIPAYSRRILGSSVILCPSHYSFPGLLKTLQARVLPDSSELFGIRMSPAGEEPASGPNQGAVRKGDRM